MPTCPTDNTLSVEQNSFWQSVESGHLEQHQIGWIISGGCTVLTVLITFYSVFSHLLHYHAPAEQRQIIRILYLPPVFGIISFFSYRYFRDYYYYELVQIIYEAVTITAFMLLIIEFVATTASGNSAENAIARKDKKKLPIPLCCWRYRPTKAYFMYTIKWAVLQYVVIRPAVSIAGIITNALGLYCESGGYSPHFAYAYLEAVDFISITIALYGLFVFYTLTRQELKGRRPLAKFMAIKLIVFATFYQGFVFSILSKTGTLKATTYWTVDNVANGLSALCLTVEMVFFSIFMVWAYPVSEYKTRGKGRTSIWRPLFDSINYSDFVIEIWGSLRFFVRYMLGKPGTHGPATPPGTLSNNLDSQGSVDPENDMKFHPRPAVRRDFGSAFGIEGYGHGPGYHGDAQRDYGYNRQYRGTPPMGIALGGHQQRQSVDASPLIRAQDGGEYEMNESHSGDSRPRYGVPTNEYGPGDPRDDHGVQGTAGHAY